MGLFDKFKKPAPKTEAPAAQDADAQADAQADAPAAQPDLPTLCYQIAYFVLPRLVFVEPEQTIGHFNDPASAGPYFYVKSALLLKVQPEREHALAFHTHSGELAPGKNYYILEYPVPPPLDPRQLKNQVLAPFFSAIIHEPASGAVSYYTLGQRPVWEAHPEPGTTFRSVTPDGANCNLGPGPQPELDGFLRFLREHLEPSGT